MKFILGVCLGALIGTIIEGMKGQPKMIAIIVFGSLTAFFGLIIGIGLLSRKLWPNRDKWWATSFCDDWIVSPQENPQNALLSNRGQIWRSPLIQEEGAWFEVDMGKPRTIARIEFLTDNSDIEKPKKWRMMFYGEDTNRLKRTLCHKNGEDNIFAIGKDIPNPIRWFRVEIQEVAENMPAGSNYFKRNLTTEVFWTISLIRIHEYRLNICGKRFGTHEL